MVNIWNWDKIQQTLLLILSFGMWMIFEYWCYVKPDFAAASHTTAVRLVLTNLVTGIFAYIYTKSKPQDGDEGEKQNDRS